MITRAAHKALDTAQKHTHHYQATVHEGLLTRDQMAGVWEQARKRIGVELGRFVHENDLAEIKFIPWSDEHRPDISFIRGSMVVFKPEEFEKFLDDLEKEMFRELRDHFGVLGPNFTFHGGDNR